jgi:hypothetical protein
MSRVLEILAGQYRASSAGRTNSAKRDLLFPFNELLKTAGCLHGPARHEALEEIEELEKSGVLVLERHRRDRSEILRVRLPLRNAPALFARLGDSSPAAERAGLAEIFLQARQATVTARFQAGWEDFCSSMAEAAVDGASLKPFDRSKPEQAARILQALPALFGWEDESLLRFASALLFKDSKFLEAVRPRVESCLTLITSGSASTLADLGIIENERTFLLHGPLSLRFEPGELRIDLLENPVRIGAKDIRRSKIETSATRCLTVENAAMLHELAKLGSGALLASSGSEGGFANSAVIAFLQSLPIGIELWHFGDSDPKGFDILRDLRERSGREIRSLHMAFRPSEHPENPLDASDQKTIERLLVSEFSTPAEKAELEKLRAAGDKGDFEQESLGRPSGKWPFY